MRRILEILENGEESREAYILCWIIFAASFTGQLANAQAERISEGTSARVRATAATLPAAADAPPLTFDVASARARSSFSASLFSNEAES